METVRIDPQFHSLIPPLSADERAQLEANLLADGCRDPLVLWNGVLLDGHNRYDICTKHGIKFATVERECKDRDDAVLWIISNQCARRNLSDFSRIELALKLEPLIAARAKANQKAAGGAVPLKSAKPVDTRKEVAKLAGVSPDTVRKAKVIIAQAPEAVKDNLRARKTKIHKEHSKLKRAKLKRAKPAPKLTPDEDYQQRIAALLHVLPDARSICKNAPKLTQLAHVLDKWIALFRMETLTLEAVAEPDQVGETAVGRA